MPGGLDKTERATPKRRDQARQRGQVGRSTDLNSAGVLLAGLVGVLLMGPKVLDAAANAMTDIFEQISRPHNVVSGAGLHGLVTLTEKTLLKTVGPIAGLCVLAGVTLNLLQVGFRFTPQVLQPRFGALNPVSGFKNLFSSRTTFNLVKDLFKVTIVGGLVAIALIPDIMHVGASVGTTPYGLGLLMKSGTKAIAMRAVAAYLLIGIADYVWQRYRFEKSIKMTKQEVKEENKQKDLPPEVKRALRRRQFQAARARMMAAVPRADVVVTNPTHYAIALEYDGEHPAPIVIAKGKDHVAAQIRRIAEENGVPLVPDPPLARELYRAVELDKMIPAELYAAVAQVLAFVYRMAARKRVGV
ncbi:MAG TPA: flagellar biosynthesis protein FlhB [Solirubrobacteraceae bacterium]|jgi:flagellar biosynthetic protein FlhB|nr:flagellar biosynthesis protein FlhB [Solirubrobacteraceae bacterium]